MFEGNTLTALVNRLRAMFIGRDEYTALHDVILSDDNGDVLTDDNGDVLSEG